jgi:hypothetical protein
MIAVLFPSKPGCATTLFDQEMSMPQRIDVGEYDQANDHRTCQQSPLAVEADGSLTFNGWKIEYFQLSAHPLQLFCTASVHQISIWANDLLLAAYGSEQIQPQLAQTWLSSYIRARAALAEILNLFSVTSTGSVLRGFKGSDAFLETFDLVRGMLPRFPVQFDDEAALFGACLCLGQLLKSLGDDFERADLAACMSRIRGGLVFLEAFLQAQDALVQLPLFGQARRSWQASEAHVRSEVKRPPSSSVIDKKEEYQPLRDEILKQIDWQQPLFLAILTAGGIFLSLALQPNVSGLVAMILPILGLGIAIKLSAHDLRVGQLTFHLRFILKSPWEILRRRIFNGSKMSREEQQVLAEQGINLPETDKKHPLAPLLPDMHTLAHRIVFFTVDMTALGIGIIRTFREALHFDLLTLFIWTLSFLATVATVFVLQRRRVR